MRERDFAYAVARIRSLETKLIDDTQLERFANSSNLNEAVGFLGETEYSAALASLKDSHHFELALNNELDRVIRLLLNLAQGAPEMDVFIYRYDIENLKKILKNPQISAEKLSQLGIWKPEWLIETVASDLRDLPDVFCEAIIEARRVYKETDDVQEIDRILDKAWFGFGFHTLKQGISMMLLEWWLALIDLTNFRTFVRIRLIGLPFSEYERFFLENGKIQLDDFKEFWDQTDDKILLWLASTPYSRFAKQGDILNSLTVLEREYDNFLTDLIAAAKSISLGIEPLVGYLIAKEIEVKTLRIILVGKINEVPNLKLKERLRRAYA